MKECFGKLQGCLQTEITCADGEKIVLFSNEPFTDEEKAELGKFTWDELELATINELGFKRYKLREA